MSFSFLDAWDYANRAIETTDKIDVWDSGGQKYTQKWADVETFIENNIDTLPNGITISDNIINTGVSGGTLGTATGGTFVTHASAANQTIITFSNYKMVITDVAGTCGHGSLELIDFPQGMIDINGVIADVSIDSVSGIGATGTFDMAMGTTATAADNETLAGTEVDIAAKVDGTLVTGADTIDLVVVTLANFDGHTSDVECYLNVAVTDTDMTATGWMSIYGTITITWINLGDY